MKPKTLAIVCTSMITVGTLVVVLTVLIGEQMRADVYWPASAGEYGAVYGLSPAEEAGGGQAAPDTDPQAATGSGTQGRSDLSSGAGIASNRETDGGGALADAVEPPASFLIPDVPALSQFPVFYNGCELVSLAMLLQYKGWGYTLEELNDDLPLDPTPAVRDRNGRIVVWGDPDVGFVGDITGDRIGYSVNRGPLLAMLADLLGEEAGRAVDLTGADERQLKAEIAAGNPVVIWTTVNFRPTDQWITWSTPEGKTIRATFQVHAAVLVGYDETHFYLNDPHTGRAYMRVAKEPLLESWAQMDKQALTIR